MRHPDELTCEELEAYLGSYCASTRCPWGNAYAQWILKNTIVGYSSVHLEKVRQNLELYDSAINFKQRFQIMWRLWYESGFSSLTYYRHLAAFHIRLINLVQVMKITKERTNDIATSKIASGVYLRDLDQYGAKLEGFFSKIKRYMRILWEFITMKSGETISADVKSLPKNHEREEIILNGESESALRATEAKEVINGANVSMARSMKDKTLSWIKSAHSWAKRAMGIKKAYTHDYFQSRSQRDLKLMQDLIPEDPAKLRATPFIELCKKFIEVGLLCRKYEERYRLNNWKLHLSEREIMKEDELKKQQEEMEERIKEARKSLNLIYTRKITLLIPSIRKKIQEKFKKTYDDYMVKKGKDLSAALKHIVENIKSDLRDLSKAFVSESSFNQEHLWILLRNELRDMKVGLFSFHGTPEQAIVGDLLLFFICEQENIEQSIKALIVDSGIELVFKFYLDLLSQDANKTVEEIKKVSADENLTAEERVRRINFFKIEWCDESIRVGGICQLHRWDEGDQQTVNFKNELLGKVKEQIKSGNSMILSPLLKASEEQRPNFIRDFIEASSNNVDIEERKNNPFLKYVYLCSFFTLDWEKPLQADEVGKAYRAMSIQVHPDRAPVCSNPILQKDRDSWFNYIFNMCKEYEEDLCALLNKQDVLKEARKMLSTLSIKKYADSGIALRQLALTESKKFKGQIEEANESFIRTIEAEERAAADRQKAAAAEEKAAANEKIIEELRKQLAAQKDREVAPAATPRSQGFFSSATAASPLPSASRPLPEEQRGNKPA